MLVDRKVFTLSKIVRPTGPGILLESDGTAVATDGHILVVYKATPEMEPEEFPKIEGFDVINKKKEKLERFVISQEGAAQVLKFVPAGKIGAAKYVALDTGATNKNELAMFGTTDGQVVKVHKMDSAYPDYGKVLKFSKNAKPQAKIWFTVSVLEKMIQALKGLDVTFFEMTIRDEQMPVEINATQDFANARIRGAIAPAKGMVVAKAATEEAAKVVKPKAKAAVKSGKPVKSAAKKEAPKAKLDRSEIARRAAATRAAKAA